MTSFSFVASFAKFCVVGVKTLTALEEEPTPTGFEPKLS